MPSKSFSKRLGDKFDRDVLPKLKSVYFSINKRQRKTVVFVAGVQRSGTNMMMDVLDRSWETDTYHERDSRAFDNYQMKDLSVIKELCAKSNASHFVIKSLCELQNLTKFMEEFSLARTIWVTRNYEDIVNSMLLSFRNQAKQIRALSNDRTMGGWWLGKGMSDETYELVKSFARPDLDDASAAALQWYFRSKLFFDQDFDKDPRVLLVKYENLVMQPADEFQRVFSFLKLKFTDRVSKKIFASSINKRPAPEINPEIRKLCDDITSRFLAVQCDR